MKLIHVLPIGTSNLRLLSALHSPLTGQFQARIEILPTVLDPEFAFHPERQQHNSSELLAGMCRLIRPDTWRLLGVTSVDLFIPILTFVFGEAQIGQSCALVSMYRLRQEYYGLPPEEELLRDRLVKEAVHELGHTLGLSHCDDYRCVMAASHAVEWIDVKGSTLCKHCRARAGL